MTKEQLYTLLQSNKIDRVVGIFELKSDIDIIETAIKQFQPETHDVNDKLIRQDRPIYKEGKVEDENGDKIPVLVDTKKVQRIAAPFQKQIVLVRNAFIGTPKMSSNPETETPLGKIQDDLLQVMGKVWHDNKLDFRFNETKTRTMSELRCAWLFYNQKDEEYWLGEPIKSNLRPRVKILSYELGDKLYPFYDNNDDLIAFARTYESKALDEQLNDITIQHLELYTDERFYFKSKVKGVWEDNYLESDKLVKEGEGDTVTSYKPNLIGKIPVIYFSQDKPEWSDVQDACARIDELLSNHADTNDYFGNPILFGKGDSLSLPQKGDAGKYVEGTGDADLKFVTWNNAPESIKMELTNLFNVVYDLSNTANISFENMKGLGPMSGFAIQLMFLGATLKADDKIMATFGEGVQRCYNYLKKLFSVLDPKYKATLSFKIKPEFASILPTDELEKLSKINSAKNGGILSEETAIEINPLVKDIESEKERIKQERTDRQAEEVDKATKLAAATTKTFPVPQN